MSREISESGRQLRRLSHDLRRRSEPIDQSDAVGFGGGEAITE
jgi:hypothetical protein